MNQAFDALRSTSAPTQARIQIPIGGVTYVIWRANKSWRKEPPLDDAQADVAEPVAG